MSKEAIDLSLVCRESVSMLALQIPDLLYTHQTFDKAPHEPQNLPRAQTVQQPALSDEQNAAIATIMEALERDEVLIALSGPAGSGKTTMIRELSKLLEENAIITAVTNKAAEVLRQKGLLYVTTLHSACLAPVYRQPGASLYSYLFSEEPDIDIENYLRKQFDIGAMRLARKIAQRYGLISGSRVLGIEDFLESYLRYWGLKTKSNDVLIVDEASMLGGETLKKIRKSFSRIILIGDEFQIPPMKDTAVFRSAKVFDIRVHLTEIHRQAAYSKPLQLAQRVRSGEDIEREPVESIDPSLAKAGTPVIVWRNKTRVSVTKKIRSALGFNNATPSIGEPIICRDNHTIDDTDFVKNSLWTVESVNDKGECMLVSATGKRTRSPIRLWMEEYGGKYGLLCRYGYALTCHTAQGSEWDKVMISANEARLRIRSNRKEGLMWLYTAITRAKHDVIWVNSEIKSQAISV
ncbi:MAG: hypothetical protein DKT66_06180 [Candidatus Melainabacteria bacterium]|nr:MAG: hypothetical protein DKT66_06180 [Candidatus Melainabacteria bacterium]